MESSGTAGSSVEIDAPRRVGAYEIRELIAAGGFGAVYRAEHAERGTPAAIKIMHAELAASPDVIARFEREIAILQRIRHPSVPEVLDFGRLPDARPYLAMELLAGTSLEAHLRGRDRLPVDECLEILAPLCGALAAAHAMAIVHRDIKASNVFLTEDRVRRAVLLDFGVAKLLDAGGPNLTVSGHIVGTVACMAPEQILSRDVDARTDVYALGALAYRMLTGQPLFAARNLIAMQQMHLFTQPRPPSEVAPVEPALDAPILQALRKEPDARQPGADAFLAALLAAAGRR